MSACFCGKRATCWYCEWIVLFSGVSLTAESPHSGIAGIDTGGAVCDGDRACSACVACVCHGCSRADWARVEAACRYGEYMELAGSLDIAYRTLATGKCRLRALVCCVRRYWNWGARLYECSPMAAAG